MIDDRWAHGSYGGWGSVGCSAYSYTLRGTWDRRLTKKEKASPRTSGQRAGREEFPSWPALQEQRREAERKEKEAAALAATRFSPQLAKAVKAAEVVVADPSSHTFRTLERRRQAIILGMEQQARRAAAKQGHSELFSVTADDELHRLMQLTCDPCAPCGRQKNSCLRTKRSRRQQAGTAPGSTRSRPTPTPRCRETETAPSQNATTLQQPANVPDVGGQAHRTCRR
jgi:hypothetical protein